MQTSTHSSGTYPKAAFALLCGAAVFGVLLGTLCFCLGSDAPVLHGTLCVQRRDCAKAMAGSLLGSTVFLMGFAVLGFCAIAQPFELALLVLRGMGIGYSLAGICAGTDRHAVLLNEAAVLPGAVLSTLALTAAAREALMLSNIYLKLTVSGRTDNDMRDTAKLYGAKLLVIEAVLALAAGADTLMMYFMIY